MKIRGHEEPLPMFVTKLGHYPIVLRITCLRLHDVGVRFASNTITFGSQYCIMYCHDAPVTVQGVTEEPLQPVCLVMDIYELQIRPLRPFRGNTDMLNRSSFFRTVKNGQLRVFKAYLYDIDKALEAKDLEERPLEEIVPEQYPEFLPLFSKVLADRLPPPHRPGNDHEVRLRDGETPRCGPLYSMLSAGLVVLK